MHNCFLSKWTHNTLCYFDAFKVSNSQMMVCVLDYEFVCILRTDGSTLVPMDTTSAQPQAETC